MNATSSINLPLSNPPFFDRIVLKAGESIPENLDLQGCIAFTRDANSYGILHKIIYIFQRIIAFFSRKKELFDSYMSHGFIVLKKDQQNKDHLFIAHSIISSVPICTASRNYLQKKDVTEVVIYRPRNPEIREMLTRYGYQTAYTDPSLLPDNEKEAGAKKGKGSFSVGDMIASIFVPQTLREKADIRIAYLAADLLLGNQFKSVNGKKQESMFCSPYALSVLQGSVLINAMTGEERKDLVQLADRAKIAQAIFERFKQKTEDNISKTYWQNDILRIKTLYAMSAHIGEVLHSMSEELNLPGPLG
jgi:hypothetical protein